MHRGACTPTRDWLDFTVAVEDRYSYYFVGRGKPKDQACLLTPLTLVQINILPEIIKEDALESGHTIFGIRNGQGKQKSVENKKFCSNELASRQRWNKGTDKCINNNRKSILAFPKRYLSIALSYLGINAQIGQNPTKATSHKLFIRDVNGSAGWVVATKRVFAGIYSARRQEDSLLICWIGASWGASDGHRILIGGLAIGRRRSTAVSWILGEISAIDGSLQGVNNSTEENGAG